MFERGSREAGGSHCREGGECESRDGEVGDEEAVVVDLVRRRRRVDFLEPDESAQGGARSGDFRDVTDEVAFAVDVVFEGHGDWGAGAEGGRVGEGTLVDGKAVVVIGLDAVGVGHEGRVDIGAKGTRGLRRVGFWVSAVGVVLQSPIRSSAPRQT